MSKKEKIGATRKWSESRIDMEEMDAGLATSVANSEVESLRQRVKELESIISKCRQELELAKARIGELGGPRLDLESRLTEIVGESGTVTPEYGGYEILILEPSGFPWHDVLNVLLDCSLEVWITRKQERIAVLSKPPSI